MNAEFTQLLQKLADKLGTTAEYLWSVLVRQARVSAVEDLVQYLLVGVMLYIMIRIHRRVTATKETPEKNWFGEYKVTTMLGDFEDYPARWVGLVLAWLFTGFMLLVVFFSIPETITKVVNPEYWALQQILQEIK